MNKFMFITYATNNTPYTEVLKTYFLKSINELGIPYSYELIEDLGDWYKNTAYKPSFILNCLDRFNTYDALIFVDADATIEQYPTLFRDMEKYVDIALHYLDRDMWYGHKEGQKELLSGTLFLRNNEHVKSLVTHWRNEAQRTMEWEQKVLQRVLSQHPEVVQYELPLSYCYIKTLPDGSEPKVKVEPIILHHQVSRLYKRRKQ